MTPQTISIIATSNRGRSRIGSKATKAVIEQRVGDKVFVVWPGQSQCRWIQRENDPNFRIIEDN